MLFCVPAGVSDLRGIPAGLRGGGLSLRMYVHTRLTGFALDVADFSSMDGIWCISTVLIPNFELD